MKKEKNTFKGENLVLSPSYALLYSIFLFKYLHCRATKWYIADSPTRYRAIRRKMVEKLGYRSQSANCKLLKNVCGQSKFFLKLLLVLASTISISLSVYASQEVT